MDLATQALYELAAPGWKFPIVANWIQPGLAEVTIGDIPILKQQRAAVEKTLNENCSNRQGCKWFFSRAGLEKIAVPSTHIDPEDVVMWNRQNGDLAYQADFVRAYCSSNFCFLRNQTYVAVVWASLCRFMIDWLLVHGKELDFGFFKLNAVCARANWKNVVIGRLTARQRNGASSDTEQTRRQIRKLLHQSVMTALDEKSNTVQWTIEVTPAKGFDDMARLIELKRKQQPGDYSMNVLQLLKSNTHKQKMFDVLMTYWQRTKVRCLNLPHGFTPGQKPQEPSAGDAPAWTQTAIVEGHSTKEKTGRVNFPPHAKTVSAEELRDLANWTIQIPDAKGLNTQGVAA